MSHLANVSHEARGDQHTELIGICLIEVQHPKSGNRGCGNAASFPKIANATMSSPHIATNHAPPAQHLLHHPAPPPLPRSPIAPPRPHHLPVRPRTSNPGPHPHSCVGLNAQYRNMSAFPLRLRCHAIWTGYRS